MSSNSYRSHFGSSENSDGTGWHRATGPNGTTLTNFCSGNRVDGRGSSMVNFGIIQSTTHQSSDYKPSQFTNVSKVSTQSTSLRPHDLVKSRSDASGDSPVKEAQLLDAGPSSEGDTKHSNKR
ncbi:hypothetical protein V866_004039 [Kwoniella sp. B9012]